MNEMNNNSGNDKTMTIHDVARELGVSASTVSGRSRKGAHRRGYEGPDPAYIEEHGFLSKCGGTEPGTVRDQ